MIEMTKLDQTLAYLAQYSVSDCGLYYVHSIHTKKLAKKSKDIFAGRLQCKKTLFLRIQNYNARKPKN